MLRMLRTPLVSNTEICRTAGWLGQGWPGRQFLAISWNPGESTLLLPCKSLKAPWRQPTQGLKSLCLCSSGSQHLRGAVRGPQAPTLHSHTVAAPSAQTLPQAARVRAPPWLLLGNCLASPLGGRRQSVGIGSSQVADGSGGGLPSPPEHQEEVSKERELGAGDRGPAWREVQTLLCQ